MRDQVRRSYFCTAGRSHWLGDENPEATAAALLELFSVDDEPLAPIRLA
jgi:hypothetical protein